MAPPTLACAGPSFTATSSESASGALTSDVHCARVSVQSRVCGSPASGRRIHAEAME